MKSIDDHNRSLLPREGRQKIAAMQLRVVLYQSGLIFFCTSKAFQFSNQFAYSKVALNMHTYTVYQSPTNGGWGFRVLSPCIGT